MLEFKILEILKNYTYTVKNDKTSIQSNKSFYIIEHNQKYNLKEFRQAKR